MKSLFLAAFLLLVSGSVLLADSMEDRNWRSSQTATSNLFNVLLASNTVRVYKIIVNTAASGSTLKLFRGNNSTATATLFETYDTSVNRDIFCNLQFSSGTMYGKVGSADITILWDWIGPVPLGHIPDGRR